VNVLLRELEAHRFNVVCYADDVTVFATVGSEAGANRFTQLVITLVSKWANAFDQVVNVSKTKCMIFSRRCRLPPLTREFVTDIGVVERVESFRLLGVTLDARLRLMEHFRRKAGAAKAILLRAMAVFASHGRVTFSTALAVYRALALPTIMYAMPTLLFALKSSVIRRLLLSVSRLAALVVTGCLRGSATGTLLRLAQIRDPSDVAVSLCVSQRHMSSTESFAAAQRVLSGCPGSFPLMRVSPFTKLLPRSLEAPHSRKWLTIITELEIGVSDVVWVDGSASDLLGGAAAFGVCDCDAVYVVVSVGFDGACGPLVAEMLAILVGLCEFECVEVIVSDCMEALREVANPDTRHPVAALAHSIAVDRAVALVWAQRRCNDSLVLADDAARFARRWGSRRWPILAGQRTLKDNVLGSLHFNCGLAESRSRLFHWMVRGGSGSRFCCMKLQGIPAQLACGRIITPSLLCLFRKRDTPACVCGSPEGDAVHALSECPLTALQRATLPASDAPISANDFKLLVRVVERYWEVNDIRPYVNPA
jgi:hypothetical protein